MKIKIHKNNSGSWDLYRVEAGAEYYLTNCKTKKQATVAKKLYIFTGLEPELTSKILSKIN